jgi:hypothetical protein
VPVVVVSEFELVQQQVLVGVVSHLYVVFNVARPVDLADIKAENFPEKNKKKQ